MRKIDSKYHIEGEEIIKTTNMTPIPHDEPTFIFRARDVLALPILYNYREMCILENCTEYQLSSLDHMIAEFAAYADEHPDVMKQPGITKGK